MTKPKKHLYRIQYKDSTYQLCLWSAAEWKKVCDAKINEAAAVATEEHLIDLKDVRAIVYLPPAPEPEPETEEVKKKKAKLETEMMNEWGFVDQETMNWLEETGFFAKDEGSEV